jgi:hypothetical protein
MQSSTTFAVNSYCPFGVFADFEKGRQDVVGGNAAVNEEQVVVFEAGICESPGVVNLLVESNDGRYVVLAKIREVSLWCVQRVS